MITTRYVGVIRLPVDPEPEPEHPAPSGRVRGHRRRAGRVVRAVEGATLLVGLGVVAGIVAFIAGVGPQAGPALWVDPVWTVPPVAGGSCVFPPCAEPTFVGAPTRLRIPAIDVDTPLERLVTDAQRRLNPPKSYERAGWWQQGTPPGDIGPAVIAGHVDSYTGPAVFARLYALKAGDVVEVDRGGVWVRFRVTTVERYPKNDFPTGRVYDPTPSAELRLITCGGEFDPTKRSYRDNIVVYAILAGPAAD